MGITNFCGYCGNTYQAQRVSSQYCSNNCRISAFRAKNREHQGISDCDTLKIRNYVGLYRIKVFENTVRVERQQPAGENLQFDLTNYEKIYSPLDDIWDINTLGLLLREYEVQSKKITKSTF